MSIIYRIKFTLQMSKVQPRLAPDYYCSLILHHSPPCSYSGTGLLSFPSTSSSHCLLSWAFAIVHGTQNTLPSSMLTTFTSSPDLKQTPCHLYFLTLHLMFLSQHIFQFTSWKSSSRQEGERCYLLLFLSLADQDGYIIAGAQATQ